MMIISGGILFCEDGTFKKADIEVCENTIAAIGESDGAKGADIFDAAGRYVVPGLVDIHIHGASGADFCDGDAKSLEIMARFLASRGTTSFLGTSMAFNEERLAHAFRVAQHFAGRLMPGRATMWGINMEGPFFNVEKRGAQNANYIINPDFDMFTRLNEQSGFNIRTVAIAPELPGAIDFIKQVRRLTNVSLAHSNADYATAKAAFDAGATQVTHIFNGMSPFTHREPGIAGAAMDAGAFAELICDGNHLHPSAVRAVFKLIGEDKVCLISDAMRACGKPDGRYELGGHTVIVGGGAAILCDGTLAGSVATLFDCLRNAINYGITAEAALKAATINPAMAVGLDGVVGSLAVGKQADLLILNKDFELEKVMIGGQWLA